MLSHISKYSFSLQRFGPNNIRTATDIFNKTGAIIWNENILTTNSTVDNWTCASKDVCLNKIYNDRPNFSISNSLAELLKNLLKPLPSTQYRRLDGPYIRRIKAGTRYKDTMLRDDWHVDSFRSITIIIPLTEFTKDNGSTQLVLPLSNYKEGLSFAHGCTNIDIYDGKCQIVNFIGEPFQPLIMNGQVVHRQSENITNKDRDALIFQIDFGAFE